MSSVTNIVIAGLGGQGVLSASDILATTAFLAKRDVKKAEVHGMSQRGGAVTSDVRYGDKVESPIVSPGAADYLIIFDETQIEPAQHLLREGGTMLSCAALDSKALPSPRTLNVAMLGMLSAFFEIPEEQWHTAVRSFLPERLHEMNDEAFAMGRTLGEKEKSDV